MYYFFVYPDFIILFCTDLVEFTDEEGYGRYLDLHDCYLKYINLKGSEVRLSAQVSPSCVFCFRKRDGRFIF